MATAKKKPIVNDELANIRRQLQDGVDNATREAYEALLLEPVPEDLVELVKCLTRPKTQHH